MTCFQLQSDDIRYHWIEHFESGGAASEAHLILKYEPRVSEPSNTYKQDLFSAALLHIVSWINNKSEVSKGGRFFHIKNVLFLQYFATHLHLNNPNVKAQFLNMPLFEALPRL